MSEILSKAATPAAAEVVETIETPEAPAQDGPVGEQIALDLPVAEAAEAEATPPAATEVMFEGEHEEKPAKKTTRRSGRSKVTASSKSKVGDMFDMLTFKDV